MKQKILPTEFDGQAIRRVDDEVNETWWCSVVDVVQVPTQQVDFQTARKYWNQLRRRLEKEGSESVTVCHRLMPPAADGKSYLTDVATAQTLLRVVQSVPSPKAEPIKLWLAKVGYERMQEMADPALSLDRARQTWQQRQVDTAAHDRAGDTQQAHRLLARPRHRGRPRVRHPHRHQSPGMVGREREGSQEAPRLEEPQPARPHDGGRADLHPRWPGCPRGRLPRTPRPPVCRPTRRLRRAGGGIAKRARLQLEGQTGRRVVSGENNLAPPARKALKPPRKA
jgi:DNA-damage-inducible protein D